MQLVRQMRPSSGNRVWRGIATVLLLGVLGTACGTEERPAAQGGGPGAHGRQGEPGAEARQAPPRTASGALAAYVERFRRTQAARAVAARRWGLKRTPLLPPAPPAVKPKITFRKGFEVGDPSLPPVFTTVPTRDRIVFLTIDDGAEKDPELLRMMTELGIPYSAFLSDYVVKDDYAYFARMRDRGVALHNHTLNHRYMPALDYDEQRREICGQQDTLEKRFGTRPTLFRPPYGNYDADTLRAARSCGIKAVPLWSAEVFPDRMEWREWDRDLHPGDIVLSHFRGRGDWKGSMADMVRRAMDTITARGYAVARLEDYV
ncbi:polysaccharide deacetylase family protein [Streptomyces changanensis]|uniref:Polysaccharide deacetylase n=3 Tax=Streptomyces TaxID=1883 RepID=A0A117IVN7_9ACTN|nr:polysaccharide deacetylase family protein [Streptomyces changanensis]KUH37580.1 polysaccharide deacetylase [Streptomyces kanasensis]UUS32547.1 polysaccharide deacetylase family protein [Streptomyces changanensis]